MRRFENIDSKLSQIAKRLNAKLTIDRPGYPNLPQDFEERRIDWIDKEINKAILIQPTFESRGINSSLWNFETVAWYYDEEYNRKQKIHTLVCKSDFKIIENKVDELLAKAERDLSNVTKNDLS